MADGQDFSKPSRWRLSDNGDFHLGFCHNAPTESFWGRLKTASVHGCKFATREQARQAVMDWIAFYNHRRLHSSLGYLSPMQYEQRWYEAQRKKAA